MHAIVIAVAGLIPLDAPAPAVGAPPAPPPPAGQAAPVGDGAATQFKTRVTRLVPAVKQAAVEIQATVQPLLLRAPTLGKAARYAEAAPLLDQVEKGLSAAPASAPPPKAPPAPAPAADLAAVFNRLSHKLPTAHMMRGSLTKRAALISWPSHFSEPFRLIDSASAASSVWQPLPLLHNQLSVKRSGRGVSVEREPEPIQELKGLEQIPGPGRGPRWVGRGVGVAEEETRDEVFGLVHADDAKAQDAGTDLQAGLNVGRASADLSGHRQREALRVVGREGRDLRAGIHAEGLLAPTA